MQEEVQDPRVTVIANRETLEELHRFNQGLCPFIFEDQHVSKSVETDSGLDPVRMLDLAKIWTLSRFQVEDNGDVDEEPDLEAWSPADRENKIAVAPEIARMIDSIICQLVVISRDEKFDAAILRETRRVKGVRHMLERLNPRGEVEPRVILMVICEEEVASKHLGKLQQLLAVRDGDPKYEARFLMLDQLEMSGTKVHFAYHSWPLYVSRLLMFLTHSPDLEWLDPERDRARIHAWRCYDVRAVPSEDHLSYIRQNVFPVVVDEIRHRPDTNTGPQRRGQAGGRRPAANWEWDLSTVELNKPTDDLRPPKPRDWKSYVHGVAHSERYHPAGIPEEWESPIEEWQLNLWKAQKHRVGIPDNRHEVNEIEGGAMYEGSHTLWREIAGDIGKLQTPIVTSDRRRNRRRQQIEDDWDLMERNKISHDEKFQSCIGAAHELAEARDGFLPPLWRFAAAGAVAVVVGWGSFLLLYFVMQTWSAFSPGTFAWLEQAKAVGKLMLAILGTAMGIALLSWIVENRKGRKAHRHFVKLYLRGLRQAAWSRNKHIADCFQNHLVSWTGYRTDQIGARANVIKGRISEAVERNLGDEPVPRAADSLPRNNLSEIEEDQDRDTEERIAARLVEVEKFQEDTTIEINFSGHRKLSWQGVLRRIEDRMQKRMRESFEQEWSNFALQKDRNRAGALAPRDVENLVFESMRTWDRIIRGSVGGFVTTESSHNAVISEVLQDQFNARHIGVVGARDYLSCQVNEVDRFGFGLLARRSLSRQIEELIVSERPGQPRTVATFRDDEESGYLATLIEVCKIDLEADERFKRVVARPARLLEPDENDDGTAEGGADDNVQK
ncbi:MAG: hypothetical protein ACI8UO_002685 [Verrucomicrobiales bacterium]|jgi:hypothetical protein